MKNIFRNTEPNTKFEALLPHLIDTTIVCVGGPLDGGAIQFYKPAKRKLDSVNKDVLIVDAKRKKRYIIHKNGDLYYVEPLGYDGSMGIGSSYRDGNKLSQSIIRSYDGERISPNSDYKTTAHATTLPEMPKIAMYDPYTGEKIRDVREISAPDGTRFLIDYDNQIVYIQPKGSEKVFKYGVPIKTRVEKTVKILVGKEEIQNRLRQV